MRHPLAVARASGPAHAAAVRVGMPEREARVPQPGVLGLAAGQVGGVLDGAAEARRADQRAVAAAQAAVGDLVPARVLGVGLQQVADVGDVERAAHRRARSLGGGVGRVPLVALGVAVLERREHVGPTLAADLHHEAVAVVVEELGQRQVEAGGDPRAGVHRHAEARPAGAPAVDRHEEGVPPAGLVVGVDVPVAHEDAVLDRHRVQVARAHAHERVARRRLGRIDLERPVGCRAVRARSPAAAGTGSA